MNIYASVSSDCGDCWGFIIENDRNFTIDKCKYYLNKANKMFNRIFHNKTNFIKIKIEYDDNKVIYNKKLNRLIVYKNDIPVYLNDNGYICKDSVAIMDSV